MTGQKNLKNYLKGAKAQKWGIGQFNFSTLEQLRGILEAAKELKSPVILGTSEGESKFLGIKEIVALVEISKIKYQVPVFLNFDHGKNLNLIKEAIDFGYDAVHYDGSGLPLEENIKNTKKIVEYAHKKGVLVEGELGAIRGDSAIHKGEASIKEKDLTPPEDVLKYIKMTGIDSLAVAIGNIHGIYKIKPELDFERLKEIAEIAKSFLVLHGGSVIPGEKIKEAVKLGITKINFNTEIRLAWKDSLEDSFKRNPQEVKPYKILPGVQNAIKRKVKEKIKLLGSQNKS